MRELPSKSSHASSSQLFLTISDECDDYVLFGKICYCERVEMHHVVQVRALEQVQ
jgi:hypothetical protein